MNILIADDHALFIKGLSYILEGIYPQSHILLANSWYETHQLLSSQTSPFQLIILDIFMPGVSSWEVELCKVIHKAPHTPTCIMSAYAEKHYIETAFRQGVKGYLCKNLEPADIKTALLQITQGSFYPLPHQSISSPVQAETAARLTLRQKAILQLVAQGDTNKHIAEKLNLKENTIKRHIYNICNTLNVENRMQAVVVARNLGELMPAEQFSF